MPLDVNNALAKLEGAVWLEFTARFGTFVGALSSQPMTMRSVLRKATTAVGLTSPNDPNARFARSLDILMEAHERAEKIIRSKFPLPPQPPPVVAPTPVVTPTKGDTK